MPHSPRPPATAAALPAATVSPGARATHTSDRRAGALALLAAAALAGCSAGTGTPAAHNGDSRSEGERHYGRIAFHSCTLANPYSPNSIDAQCARFEVRENRALPQSRRIALNIAWLPATQEGSAAADPVFFLAGGPGQAATEVWPQLDAAFAEVRRNRHVVLIDQRGTGGSNPLICRNSQGRSAMMERENDSLSQAVKFAGQCARGLNADPRYYTTTDAVADLDAVRAALGVERIDLVGVSYGTRVAQQYAGRHPQQVRTLLLDGVIPNDIALGADTARNLDAALVQQFDRCRRDQACRERFGDDPREQLRKLMARVKAAPVQVDYRDPETGETLRDKVTPDTIAGLTRMFAYTPQAASVLPLVLNEADNGRYAPLMSLAKMLQTQFGDALAYGMQLSVVCAEDIDLMPPNPDDADTLLGGETGRVLAGQCRIWPTGQRPADFHAPLKSAAPALLLSGEFDPVTPARYGEQVLKGLSQGRHLVLRGQGHGNFAVGCMPKLMARFIESADARQLDAKCLDSLNYVPPFVSFNGWQP